VSYSVAPSLAALSVGRAVVEFDGHFVSVAVDPDGIRIGHAEHGGLALMSPPMSPGAARALAAWLLRMADHDAG
jgi:hypothetical protein